MKFLSRKGYNLAINLVNKLSIIEILVFIKHYVDILVGCDSSLGHIAALFGKTTLSIFGPTDPVVVAPYSNSSFVIDHPLPCAPCYLTKDFYGCRSNDCMNSISFETIALLILEKIGSEQRVYPDSRSRDRVKKMQFFV